MAAKGMVAIDQSRRRRKSQRQLRKNLTGYAFVMPWILGLLVFQAYPIFGSIYYSFTRYNVLQPPSWIAAQNYVNLFTKEPLLWRTATNTLYMVVVTVPLGLVLSLGMAMLMNQKISGVGFYRTVYYLPSLVPPVASTLLWLLLLHPEGLLNSGLQTVGLPRLGWFRDPTWSKPALVLMGMWGVGGSALIFLGGLKEIPISLYEAARIDGANAFRQWRHVTLPLLTPVIFFNLIMGVIGAFQTFAVAFIAGGAGAGGSAAGAGGGGPLNSMLMYMVLLYRYGFRYFQMGYASAMAMVLAVVILAITLVLIKTSGGWVYYEASRRG